MTAAVPAISGSTLSDWPLNHSTYLIATSALGSSSPSRKSPSSNAWSTPTSAARDAAEFPNPERWPRTNCSCQYIKKSSQPAVHLAVTDSTIYQHFQLRAGLTTCRNFHPILLLEFSFDRRSICKFAVLRLTIAIQTSYMKGNFCGKITAK